MRFYSFEIEGSLINSKFVGIVHYHIITSYQNPSLGRIICRKSYCAQLMFGCQQ